MQMMGIMYGFLKADEGYKTQTEQMRGIVEELAALVGGYAKKEAGIKQKNGGSTL